ncbi:hypothetical protein [Streptomyces sp. URMC 129]|uniref:hypothetical protein n=1 Tax=Streptomyces sp. URMC 129 TaxID=3423407 RepID=UPI003F1E231B
MTPPARPLRLCSRCLPPNPPRPAVFYPDGWCCPEHTPAARAGRPEPQPGPGLPAGAWTTPSPQNASAVADNRAVASGKRRANPAAYRAAQNATRPPRS